MLHIDEYPTPTQVTQKLEVSSAYCLIHSKSEKSQQTLPNTNTARQYDRHTYANAYQSINISITHILIR